MWRKYNPYQPYEEGGNGEVSKDQSLESLDDLFTDMEDSNVTSNQPEMVMNNVSSPEETSKSQSMNMPTPQKSEEEVRQEELVDIQKELEAKFDELFGSSDEGGNN